MPRQLDQRIADILRKYGEDPSDTKTVLWDCHGTWVVYHAAVERMAARAGVTFDMPQILRAERDEAVILVSASLGERKDWDIGECLVGINYKVSGRQSAFVWAMASKRARDRVILKLVGLHGLIYSEEEADAFKVGQTAPEPDLAFGSVTPAFENSTLPHAAIHVNAEPELGSISVNGEQVRMSAYAARKDGRWEPLVSSLRACRTMEALHQWADDNFANIGELPGGWVQELRSEYEDRAREIKVRG